MRGKKLTDKENSDAIPEVLDFFVYSMTWMAPEGHWHSQALQTKHSSTLAGEDLPSLTS